MPLSTLLIAAPLKVGAIAVGATLVSVGGYAAYERYYDPYDAGVLPVLPVSQAALYEPAPPVEALPFARPAPVGYVADPSGSYAWAERAAALTYAFADAPPDYGYGWDGTEYWTWETDGGWSLDVEPVYGGDRYYYYGPRGLHPFFVLDAGYGYGFDDAGVLVVVYDSYGRVMPADFVRARSDWAGRYLYRGSQLRQARLEAARENRRWRVDRARWLDRQDRLREQQARLERAALQQSEWQAYRARVGDRERRFFADERRERLRDARRAEGELRRDLRQARLSSDAPPALTLAERRRAAADELVVDRRALRERREALADGRQAFRGMARDEARRERRADAREGVLSARREARGDFREAYRDAKAERRAAIAADPSREGRAAARREVLADRAEARAERQQAYRAAHVERRAATVRERPRTKPLARPETRAVRSEAVRDRRVAAQAREARIEARRAVPEQRAAARAERMEGRTAARAERADRGEARLQRQQAREPRVRD